jgi:hypothetical protein
MQQEEIEPSAARVLRAAAVLMETRQRSVGPFQAGPDAYTEIHRAHTEVFGLPAIKALERHLGVRQLQHWSADTERDVAREMRAAADGIAGKTEQDAQDEGHAARLQGVRNDLAAALGMDGPPWNYEVGHLVNETRDLYQGVARLLAVIEVVERDGRELTVEQVRRALWRAAHTVRPATEEETCPR